MWWNNVETKPFGGYPAQLGRQAAGDARRGRTPAARSGTWPRRTGTRSPTAVSNGKTIFEAAQTRIGPEGPQTVMGYLPTEAEWRTPNMHEDSATGGKWKPGEFNGSTQLPEHRVWFFYLARICNHCTYPGCLGACPRQAIYKRPEDGIVLIDQSPLPRLPQVRRGLPLQEGHVPRQHAHEREVRRLLSAHRGQRP